MEIDLERMGRLGWGGEEKGILGSLWLPLSGRLMCILSNSYGGSMRGGCYFHFTVEESEEHRIYVADPSSPS